MNSRDYVRLLRLDPIFTETSEIIILMKGQNDSVNIRYFSKLSGKRITFSFSGKVKAANLREPEFIGGEVDLRINICRGQISGTNFLKHGISDSMNADKLPGNRR